MPDIDPAHPFSSSLSQKVAEHHFDTSHGLVTFVKLRQWGDPLCYRVRGVPGLGPGGFDDVTTAKVQHDDDFKKTLFSREVATGKCQVSKNLLFSETGGIIYLEYSPPEYEEAFFTATPLRSARGLMGLFALIDTYATSTASADINEVARELLAHVGFDEVRVDVLALASAGEETDLSPEVDQWLWRILLSTEFDNGL